MNEIVLALQSIIEELREINSKLDEIRGSGMHSVDDLFDEVEGIADVVEGIAGSGLYNSISDVYDKLDSVETTITLGSNY